MTQKSGRLYKEAPTSIASIVERLVKIKPYKIVLFGSYAYGNPHKNSDIEDYPYDSPLPSILLNGKSTTNNPLHVVVAINIDEKFLIIITVYEPNPVKWMNNYARRLK